MPLGTFSLNSAANWSKSHLDHLKVGYGPHFSQNRELSFFHIQCGQAATPPMAFKDECIRAARLIAAEAAKLNKKIVIPLSGGLDSEVVARSFLEAGIPFEAATLKYKPDLNDHDISYAVHFCRMNNVKLHITELDVFEYYKTADHRRSAEKYFCNSPMFSVHLELCRKYVDDFLVFAGIAPLLHAPPAVHNYAQQLSRYSIIEMTLSQFTLIEFPVENTFCYSRFFSEHGTSGISHFFLYTPELMLSSLSESDVIEQIKTINILSRQFPASGFDHNKLYHTQKIRSQMKYEFYKKLDFPVLPRPNKYTGFEKIHRLCADKTKIAESFSDPNDYKNEFSGLLKFNKLYREPMEINLPPIRLGQLQIDSENKKWLQDYALRSWSKNNL